MAIITEQIEQKEFNNYDEMKNWAKKSSRNLIRVPVNEFLSNRACFFDDEYLGDGDYVVRFNDNGFQQFCSILRFRTEMLRMIETPNLASQVLNDLILQEEIKKEFGEFDFIIDDSKKIILGIVSGTYVGYSNETYLNDIESLLNDNGFDEKLAFKKAYAVNSELNLIFNSTFIHGEIDGRGGKGKDKSEIGLAFRNSMVGSCSVSINYHLFRLACSNGMMVPASESVKRIYHSGNISNFKNRLYYSFSEVYRKLDMMKKLLIDLDSIDFSPDYLANDRLLAKEIFDIIPGTKQALGETLNLFLSYPKGASEQLKIEIQIKHDKDLISKIPDFYGGENSAQVFKSHWREQATMFDFLNVFTEYAKKQTISKKLQIEERTGALADYIYKNAKKFN
jgi:hypothetical protein